MTATADLPNKALQDFTEKLSFVDGDMGFILDSQDGNKLKKINKTLMIGDTGASITSAVISGDDIVFTKDDLSTVTLTGAVTSLKGEDGREIELQVNATHIQWRYVGDVSWTDLIALSLLKGDDGACVVSVSFVGDDMVFVLDDASTVSIVGAKTTLKGADGTDGISFTPKGEYAGGTTYVANDVVSYLGSSWIALQSTTGNSPAEGAYWTLNAAKGTDGAGSGDISGSGTANEIAYFTAEKTIDNLPVATYPSLAELAYVKGVTSSIQTQINGKQATGSYEVTTNKETSALDTSTSKYPCNNVVKTAVDGKVPTSRTLTINGTALDLSADRSWTITAGGSYWTATPTPTRTDDNTITVADTGGTSGYANLLSRGVILKRTESATVKQAMIASATYGTNVVTIELLGDTFTAGFDAGSLKYGAVKAKEITFAYLPTVGTGTDIMGRWFAGEKTKVHGAIAYHGTAGTTNATTYDVNKNGTTIFTTKLSVATTATVGSDTTADNTAYLDTNDYMTVDCDSVSTTAPVYATIKVFVSPFNDIYLA